ncbi:hypothetical protein DACRYDRAFT_112046 [Dacryopinax primogenitus]|uniref:Uncharacterized protein n=1 Tax=Dacryopinax primogenitus (strain DJM 731) TaxID=1858805 RepID=M5FQP5_DACPD|nr:uncharacterized protein DACRYDRAFT_112046 [Dacryopinax primogenitus]EJT97084.1 hypothetical protein DACRYDRAFT_112046 [Dacryopinax primogenitus]
MVCKSVQGYRQVVQRWDDAVAFELDVGVRAGPEPERYISLPLVDLPKVPEMFVRAVIMGDETSLAPLPTLRAPDDHYPFYPPQSDDDDEEGEYCPPLSEDDDWGCEPPQEDDASQLSRAPSRATSRFTLLTNGEDGIDEDTYPPGGIITALSAETCVAAQSRPACAACATEYAGTPTRNPAVVAFVEACVEHRNEGSTLMQKTDKVTQSISGTSSQAASWAQQPVHISMPQASAAEALQVLDEFLQENRTRTMRVKGIVEGVAELLASLTQDSDTDVLNRLNERAQTLSDTVERISSSFSTLVQTYLEINDSNASRFVWNLRRRVTMTNIPALDDVPPMPMNEEDSVSLFREVCNRIGTARREVDGLDGRLNALLGTVNYILGPEQRASISIPNAIEPPDTEVSDAPTSASTPATLPVLRTSMQLDPSRLPKDYRRPQATRYYVYVDGRGWVGGGRRDAHYCTSCRPPPTDLDELDPINEPDYYDTDHGQFDETDEEQENQSLPEPAETSDDDPESVAEVTNPNPHAVISIPEEREQLAQAFSGPHSEVQATSTFVNSHTRPDNSTSKNCGHNYCQLSRPVCCACSDSRPVTEFYYAYRDGLGWRPDGFRGAGYCSSCLDHNGTLSAHNATFQPSQTVASSTISLGAGLTERQLRRRDLFRDRLARAFGTLQEIRDDPSYVSPMEAMFQAEEPANDAQEPESTFEELAKDATDIPSATFSVDNSCRVYDVPCVLPIPFGTMLR